MAKTYGLYESTDWVEATPEERELLEVADSRAILLEHPTLKDRYIDADPAGQRDYEARITLARQEAFPQYFPEPTDEITEEVEPDTPDRTLHDTGVPLTSLQQSAHEEMRKSRPRYQGGMSQIKMDESIYKTINGGHSKRLSDNELARARVLLGDPSATREKLLHLEDSDGIQTRLATVTGIKKQTRSWENDYDALSNEADNSAIESIRPRATKLKSEIDLLEQALPSQRGDADHPIRGGITQGLPRQTKLIREAEARAKKLYPDQNLREVLDRKKAQQETLALNLQMNLLASDEASGHRPNIRGEWKRGNTPEWIDLVPPLADAKGAQEMFHNIKLLDTQQEALALGKADPLNDLEQAQVSRFLLGIQNEGSQRSTVGVMNGLADMYPYALAIAVGGGVVAGGRKAMLTAAKTSVKKRVLARLTAAGAQAGVASALSTGSILEEAGRKSIDPDVIRAEFDTEEGQALTNYLSLDNPVSNDFARKTFEGYADNYLENMTEMVGGGITRGILHGRAAFGRRVIAANVKKINPRMKTGKINKLLLTFENTLANNHVKKFTKGVDAVLLGQGDSKVQKGLGALGLDGFGGEFFEESVAAMKDSLLEIGVAEDDKSAHSLAQKLMNPTLLLDPTQGGDMEDWAVLAATIGLPGSLRTGASGVEMYKKRQTKKRRDNIAAGQDLLTTEDGQRVVPDGNREEENDILNILEEAERAEQRAKVEAMEAKLDLTEEILTVHDQTEGAMPEHLTTARLKKLSSELDDYAAALYDQRVTEGTIQERRTAVEGSAKSQADNLHEAVAKMDAWYDKNVTRFAARRANGFVSTKEWKETLHALVTGLTPIHTKSDRLNTEDKIYRTLRFGGANPRTKRQTHKEVADIIRGKLKPLTRKRGGIIHMSRALNQVAPSMYNRLNYHELGRQIRKAEQKALSEVANNATEADVVKAIEGAGRAVVSKALDQGFFPVAGVANAAHRKLLTAAQKEIQTYDDEEGRKYATLDESTWEKFTPAEQKVLGRYLTRVADLPEGADPVEALAKVTLGTIDTKKLKQTKGRKLYLTDVIGSSAPSLVSLLDDPKLIKRWANIVVVPDTILRKATSKTGHFGTKDQSNMVSRAFNVGDTLYVSVSATRADLTEESIEGQMAENGFFSNPVTTGIATEALRAHVSLMLTQLNEKLLELQTEADAKGATAPTTMQITLNKGLPNESVSEIRIDEEIERLQNFLDALTISNENRTLFEFLSSVFTLHVGGSTLSAKDLEDYRNRSDVRTYTALIDLALTFPRSRDAFNNFLVNMTDLYFPEKQWGQVRDDSKEHPSPLGGALQDSRTSRTATSWSLLASGDFIESQFDIVDQVNTITTPQAILAEMIGGIWDESTAADDADLSDDMLEQALAQEEAEQAIREVDAAIDEAEAAAEEAVEEAKPEPKPEPKPVVVKVEEVAHEKEVPADKDVEDKPKPEPKPAPTEDKSLRLKGGVLISAMPNKAALIKEALAIREILGGRAFEIAGRSIMPRATLNHIIKTPQVLSELSQEQLQLMLDRIDLVNEVTPSSTNVLTGDPLTKEELLERLIQEVLNLADAIDLDYSDSPLVTGGVPTVEEIVAEEVGEEIEEPEPPPSPEIAGAVAAQNLHTEYLKKKSPLHEFGAVATAVEALLTAEIKNPAFVKAFMESFYYRSPVPKNPAEMRLAAESIASKIEVGLRIKAMEGAALAESAEDDPTLTEDEIDDQELVGGADNTQFLEYDVRFAEDTRKLFKNIGLQGTFGARFVMNAIQESTSIRTVIKQGAALNARWLTDKTYSVKDRNNDIELLITGYLKHGTYGAQESFLIDSLQKAGLSKLAMFNAFRDLTTRFHGASSRPASEIQATTAPQSTVVKLRAVPFTSNTGASMVASLATNLSRKLATREEALKFFDLIDSVSKMSREYVYNFWELMLSEPADIIEFADVAIGVGLKEKKPGLPQSAKELGPLFTFAKDPNVKGYWPAVVETYRKQVEDAKPEEFQSLMAEVSRKLRLQGLTTAASSKAQGLNRIAQLALNMPESEAPASYRRADGTLKANVNSPDQITQMVALERERLKADKGEDHPFWILREIDMVDARGAGRRRAINFEDLLESEHIAIHRNNWETARKNRETFYDAWSGPIGDKTSIRTVTMPLMQTYKGAVKYYEQTIAEGGLLTNGERAHEAVKSVEEIIEAGERGEFDNSEDGLTFELNDRANRLRIMHAIHGDFSKFGGSIAFTKRASATGSSGVTMTKEGFGDSKLKALRLTDAKFLTTALQLAIDKAELDVKNASSSSARQRAEVALEMVKEEAHDFLEQIESTDGAALILPQARDRIQWAYGPLLTQEAKYGSLKVAKTIHTGHGGLDKQGATILTPDYANHAEGSAYRTILDAITTHLKTLDPDMKTDVAEAGGLGDNRIDIVFFSSGDKAKSGKEYDLFAEGADQALPESSLTDVPINDFYWLLSASHDTQASAMQMPVQAVAVLSGLPEAFNDLLNIQDAAVDHAKTVAQAELKPENVIKADDHVLAPFSLGDNPSIKVDNVFMGPMLSNKQAIKLSKESRPVIMGNQLVETPIAAPPEVLADYHKVSESGDGLWDADEKGTRVRLARADFNSDNVRFGLTTTARTVAEAEAMMRNPEIFPMVLDMFEIPRADLQQLAGISKSTSDKTVDVLATFFTPEYINSLTFRSWELEKEGEFIRIPGEPVLVQRVPSDGVYSTSMVRAGKRMLTESGESPNIIATSQGVQIGSGADFDIDKRFVMSMRRSRLKADEITDGEARAFAEQTFVKNEELGIERTNVGYDLTSPRWSSYNRFLLGMATDFGDVANFEVITSRLDGDLNKKLVDKALAEDERRAASASWEGDLASIYGAARLYRLNSVGKSGLGRSATSMFSAGVMHGMGYGVVSDQSFDFEAKVEGEPVTMQIKVNRLAGDKSNFQIARSSIGLVMNQYTDHTKLQVIDKLGGDEITASLFATLYYLNKDLVPDDAPAEGKDTVSDYGEVIWRALATPEIQAWASLQRLKFKLNLSKDEKSILTGLENEMAAIPTVSLGKMFELQNPGQKPNTELWDIVLGGSQEMLDVERLFRGYRNPMPTDSINLFNKKQRWMKRANGIAAVAPFNEEGQKVWTGIPTLFQLPEHAAPEFQAFIISNPFAAEKRKPHKAYRATFKTASVAVANVAGLEEVSRSDEGLEINVDSDAPTHRYIYSTIRENLKDAKLSEKTEQGDTQEITADTSKVGLEKTQVAINRLVFATSVMASYPVRVGKEELEQRISGGLKDAYANDETNVFLTQGISELAKGKGRFKYEVPSGTAGVERSQAELANFHSAFTRLPPALKQDLLLYAVTQYGLAMHTAFGSYLPYVDPMYLLPFINGADSMENENFNFRRATNFALRASRADRPLVVNLNDLAHPPTEAEAALAKVLEENPERALSVPVKKALVDAEAVTEEEGKRLEDTAGEEVTHPKPDTYEHDYELNGVSKADWDTYFEFNTQPLLASTIVSQTVANLKIAGEVSEITENLDWIKKDLAVGSAMSLEAQTKKVEAIEHPQVREAALEFLQHTAEERTELRKTVNRVRKAAREKAQIAQAVTEGTLAEAMGSMTGEDPAKIKEMLDGDPRDIDNGLSQSAFFTKLIKSDASTISSNQAGREMLLTHSRKAETDHVILSAAAERWQNMTGSRGNTYDDLIQDERPGEALLKALTVMYEAGIRTEADLRMAQTAQNLYDQYPAKAQPKTRTEYLDYLAKHPNVVRLGLLYYWESSEDLKKVDPRHGGGYVVPKSKRISIEKVLETYRAHAEATNAKLKEGAKTKLKKKEKRLSSWNEVMADFSRTLDDAVKRMNNNVGYDWLAKPDNRVFHVLDSTDRGSFKAPALLGMPEEAQGSYLENTSYLQMAKRGTSPATFNISENFASWLNATTAKARLVGVIRSSALMVDANGVPGMIMGATATPAGEKLTPYDRRVGFAMLNNLRKKLSEQDSVKLPPLNTATSPWVQAAELAAVNPKAMAGLGYVQIKTHALGPNVDQVWAIQGTLDKVVQHVSVTGFQGKLQQAKADEAKWRARGWAIASATLSATKLLKGLNVGFSAFHHFALAESAVANVGLTFRNPIFHLGNYWMAGRRGLKLYREMVADPTIMGKWAGRGLKSSTLPLDALHYEMTSGWFSRAGHAIRNDGKGIFKKTKFGDAVGGAVLLAGNIKKATDNLLWHGMVPTMKVHMAERMFEQFRADPRLNHLSDEKIGHDIAKYVNDALGGQEWEQYMNMNPLMQDWANMIMFAPDWTLSALNVAGMSKAMGVMFGLDGPIDYTDDHTQTISTMGRQRVLKYLPGFFMNVLIMPTIAIQAMIYTLAGSPDDGDEMWTWNNEEGKKFLIDFSPLIRDYARREGIFAARLGAEKEVPERRAYITPGKQLREVLGWAIHPAKTLYGKSSNVVRLSNLIVFKSKTHPFSPQPWTVDREDVAMEAVYTLLPFVASGWLKDEEVPLGMRMYATVTRGASEWTLAKRASDVYMDAASGKGYSKLTPRARIHKLNEDLDEIWRSAELNGVDIGTVQTEGRSQARTIYNARLMEEMIKANPNADVMSENLTSLAVLEPNYRDRLDSLRRTVDYRVNKSAKLSKEEKARLRRLYDSLRFKAEIRDANDTHARTWGRTGGVIVD